MVKIKLRRNINSSTDDAQTLRVRGLFAILNGLLLIAIVLFELTATAATLINSPSTQRVRPEGRTEIETSVDKVLKQVSVDPTSPPEFDANSILEDYEDRVSDQFTIDPRLKGRVSFWFDIYTKYPSESQVIHHREFPWVVFKVIDISPIIYSDKPSRRWQRNLKAEALVKGEMKSIRAKLLKLSKIGNPARAKLSEDERILAEAIKVLPGNFSRNAKFAAANVRVQTGQKDHFEQGLIISSQYLPEMDRIFVQHKIPAELTRIPLVESSFNHLATSKAGASGVWQFIGNTGKKFLIIKDGIDERRSPLKSTHAAARLLKENHMILSRQWPLAITAYNHGPGGVRKATKVVGSTDIAKILGKYKTKAFGFAGTNYFPSFLAALYAEKYKDEIFTFAGSPNMFTEDNIILPRAMRTNSILKVTGLSADEVLLYNPDLKQAFKKNTTLPRGYRLHIPSDRKDDLRAKFASKKTIESRG